MRQSTKNTLSISLFLLCVVVVTAIHTGLGIILVLSWTVVNLAWEKAKRKTISEAKRRWKEYGRIQTGK